MEWYFESADGEVVPFPKPMSAEQAAVVNLMHFVGIRKIDDGSMDEFVRRADLYSTYVGSMMYESAHGRPVAMTRKILTDAMGDNVAVARPGVELIDPNTFERQIQLARVGR